MRASLAARPLASSLRTADSSQLARDTPTSAHAIERETYEAQAEFRAWHLPTAAAAVGAFTPSPIRIAAAGPTLLQIFSLTSRAPTVAKLLQKFRAVWSRHGEDFFPENGSNGRRAKQLVSITTGPAAKNRFSMHSPQMALVMNNMDSACAPNVAHDPETVQALMPLILIRDLFSPRALGNPSNGEDGGKVGAMSFVSENSWHGGVWRSPYSLKAVGISIFLKVYGVRYLLPLLALAALLVAYSCFLIVPSYPSSLQFGYFSVKMCFCLVL